MSWRRQSDLQAGQSEHSSVLHALAADVAATRGTVRTALAGVDTDLRILPLVLDHPEDELDNRFIYDDVVSLLRAEKGVVDPQRRRQIIVTTHNANIPVNGDAELVLSLVDEGGRCVVRTRASIDDATVRQGNQNSTGRRGGSIPASRREIRGPE